MHSQKFNHEYSVRYIVFLSNIRDWSICKSKIAKFKFFYLRNTVHNYMPSEKYGLYRIAMILTLHGKVVEIL